MEKKMSEVSAYRLMEKAAILLAGSLLLPVALLAAPTSIVGAQNLEFGQIVDGAGYAGTVTIDPAGARLSSGTIRLLGGSYAPARFTITGNPGKPYTLTLPSSFSIVSGTEQMTVTGVTSSIPLVGILPGSGELPFAVGGTLTVNNSQQNTIYTGSLVITVE